MNKELEYLVNNLVKVGLYKSDIFGVCIALKPKQMDDLSMYIVQNNPTRDQVMEKFMEIVKVEMAEQERLRTERVNINEIKILLQSNSPQEINQYLNI